MLAAISGDIKGSYLGGEARSAGLALARHKRGGFMKLRRLLFPRFPVTCRRLLLPFGAAFFLFCAAPAPPQNISGILRFAVRKQGIMPPTATVSAGKALVRVSNRFGMGDLNLSILDASSIKIATIQLLSGTWEVASPVTLSAGTYTIQVTSSPSLSATITVTP
jgi:hypothetical protein